MTAGTGLTLGPDAAARIATGGRVVLTGPGGREVELALTVDGWLARDSAGRFDGDPALIARLTVGDGVRSLPLMALADPYFEPELAGRVLAGAGPLLTEESPSLAAGVPAPPVVSLRVQEDTGGPSGRRVGVVTVRAEDRGGCVGRVTLFHNGKAVPVHNGKAVPVHNGKAVPAEAVTAEGRLTEGGLAVRVLDYRVPLATGVNRFEAVAASALKIEGERAVADIPAAGGQGTGFGAGPGSGSGSGATGLRSSEGQEPAGAGPRLTSPRLHGVIVGINLYADPALTLNYAVADAVGVAAVLKSTRQQSLFGVPKVRVLKDRAGGRAAILKALAALADTAPEDVVVIYLAGHGENDGVDWFFLPTEFGRTLTLPAVKAEGLSAKDLKNALTRIRARQVLVLIDACKSGQFRRAFSGAADEKYLEWVGRTAGVHILAATAKDQLAVELDQLGHGAFTYTLLQGLAGAADRPGVGLPGIQVSDLLAFARTRLPALARRHAGVAQYPTVFSYGPDFTLAPAGGKSASVF